MVYKQLTPSEIIFNPDQNKYYAREPDFRSEENYRLGSHMGE